MKGFLEINYFRTTVAAERSSAETNAEKGTNFV
jgi:hypothetical protein